jgi:hypothetical protein
MTNVFIDTVQRTLRGRLAGGLTVNAGVHPPGRGDRPFVTEPPKDQVAEFRLGLSAGVELCPPGVDVST